MQTRNLEYVIAQATDKRQKSAIGKAVAASIEVGVVVPSMLRANLEDAGYTLVEDKAALADYGFASLKSLNRVIVNDKDGIMVAMGAAGDHSEALLHAMLGYFRENALPGSDVPAGIAEAPV
jgi:hypothetical protein